MVAARWERAEWVAKGCEIWQELEKRCERCVERFWEGAQECKGMHKDAREVQEGCEGVEYVRGAQQGSGREQGKHGKS